MGIGGCPVIAAFAGYVAYIAEDGIIIGKVGIWQVVELLAIFVGGEDGQRDTPVPEIIPEAAPAAGDIVSDDGLVLRGDLTIMIEILYS